LKDQVNLNNLLVAPMQPDELGKARSIGKQMQ
jgi:hypothetical protein